MRFVAQVRTPDGGVRTAEFESGYDAVSVLEAQVEREVLEPGEELLTRVSTHDRRTTVPDIARIA